MGITKLALSKLDGVIESVVSLKQRMALVTYDANKVTQEDLVRIINDNTQFRATFLTHGVAKNFSVPKKCGFLGLFCKK